MSGVEKNSFKIESTFNYTVVYIFKICDELHKNILKIGKSTLKYNNGIDLSDNSESLNESARKRIKQYTNTIGVQEELLYTTLAIDKNNKFFKDTDVHTVLDNSGINKHDFGNDKNPQEWYEVDLETAKNAINAVKDCRFSLTRAEVNSMHKDIQFRPEQIDAINKTIKRFKISNRMLWNAKMRFGKTLSALEVIRKMSLYSEFNLTKAIILTHRPVVDEGWFEDFKKIFYSSSDFLYGSKKKSSIKELLKSNKKFIYFASIQDLRGSEAVGGKFNKNDDIFGVDWDLVVIDEAHEGTKTSLGTAVINEIVKDDNEHITKQLYLSGTPFNLLSDFESDEIYTWDYIMEQKAKLEWENNHPLEPNPYDDLPKLNILTYNLYDFLPVYKDVADNAFNFREFFRVWTGDTTKDGKELLDNSLIGRFIHEDDVIKFLDLLTKQDSSSNYPFSKKEYIENFRHSFWILPGVKEAAALKKLMMKNTVFSLFDIVNVAGTGDDDGYEALEAVEKAIGEKPEETYTITLSCGKLTTGVTVKPWSAVLYLSGSYSTSASSYLQSIFRVQSPANIGGKQKTDAYVFDFAPDRTLKMVAVAGSLAYRSGETGSKERMRQFLNFCPVISVKGSNMEPYDVTKMLSQLKQAYIERVVDNGFDDVKMYNDNLYKLNENALSKFENLKGIIGATKQKKKISSIEINTQGFSNEQWEELKKAKETKKNERTEEQKKLIEEELKRRKQKNDAISILRGISIRIPLLIYGAEIKENQNVTVDNFTEIVDDVSWNEFMPKGVTKEIFNDFIEYYDPEIFVGAGKRIRNIAKHADTLTPVERAKSIADLFATFRNPDKETVLTPWKTVNRHMGDTLGGYNFYDENYIVSIEEPRLIDNGDVTRDVLFNTNSKILELNSKTGLYPLYVTVSLFKQRCLNTDQKKLTDELMKELWKQTIEENVFVVCRTKMAKAITKRTLTGFVDNKLNVIDYETLIDELTSNPNKVKANLLNPKFWKKEGSGNMKFDAIIGNPPYQENISSGDENASLSKQLFPLFIMNTIKLNPKYISLITPSRWFAGNAQDGSFPKLREFVKNNNHFEKIFNYPDNRELFSNVTIAGGVNYYLYNDNYVGDVDFVEVVNNQYNLVSRPLFEENLDIILSMNSMVNIVKKIVERNDFNSLTSITCGRNAFGIVGKRDSIEKISSPNYFDGAIEVRCAYEEIRYLDKKYVTKNINLMKSWKIFTSKGNGGAGLLSDDKSVTIIGKSFIGNNNSVCSDSLIPIGCFSNEYEAVSLQKYMSTKFLRFLVGILKVSQNVSQNVYQFVPIQNFTTNSDIDWSKELENVDSQLYKKYKLTADEINYIESKIKYI